MSGVLDLLSSRLKALSPKPNVPKFLVLDLPNGPVEIQIRINARAKRLSLKIDPAKGPILVLPRANALAQGKQFIQSQSQWLAERLAKRETPADIVPGQMLPFRGVETLLVHRPDAKRGTWVEQGQIHVSGPLESFQRRVVDFLKSEAKREIAQAAHPLAEQLGRKIKRITVKDTTSRWGSCSSDGCLSFSWRLIFAPPAVFHYVIAHEVAHLVEMNHQPAFWAIVAKLDPFYEVHRAWLKNNGAKLHQILSMP